MFALEYIILYIDDPDAKMIRHYLVIPSLSLQKIIRSIYHSNRPQVCRLFRRQLRLLYSSTTLKFEPALLQSLVVPIVYFLHTNTMLNTTRTIKVSSEKLPEAS